MVDDAEVLADARWRAALRIASQRFLSGVQGGTYPRPEPSVVYPEECCETSGVRCDYCGTLRLAREIRCPSCGAPY